jgi:hypothetical protein
MKKFLKFLESKGIYILIGLCLILGLSVLPFRNATLDDDLYLWETSIMTEALSRGEWIGDYAVGTHGFLFKLPVALVFLLTGPSLEIATVWNILLASVSLYLFYKILKEYFPKGIYPFLGTLLLFCNFQFILNLPTYMREIPVLLGFLVVLYTLVKQKPYWLTGLAMLLVLDGKEYVLFMIAPALAIYVLIKEWQGFNLKTVWETLKGGVQMFLPTVAFLAIMIFTSIIPVNMFALSVIPGVTEGGVEYHIEHFSVEKATENRIEEGAPEIQKAVPIETEGVKNVFSIILSYIGKILYPRSFSFISIPKVIFFPAFLTSILLFSQFFKKKDYTFLSFALILWSYILVFILRASFDRYLFPILPVVVYFFIIFIKDLIKQRKKFLFVLAVTAILASLGLFFEVDYIAIKIVLNIIVLLLYIGYFIGYPRFYKKVKLISTILFVALSGITFSVIAYFFYANGQLYYYRLWGKDYEVKKVVEYFDDDENIMINDPGWNMLINVYRGDNRYDPEWKWEFKDWVPRKDKLKTFQRHSAFQPVGISIANDVRSVETYDIDKVALIVSTLDGYSLPYEHKLERYKSADWLVLENVIHLKNKDLYIFDVTE